jgi:hypothetical protein
MAPRIEINLNHAILISKMLWSVDLVRGDEPTVCHPLGVK